MMRVTAMHMWAVINSDKLIVLHSLNKTIRVVDLLWSGGHALGVGGVQPPALAGLDPSVLSEDLLASHQESLTLIDSSDVYSNELISLELDKLTYPKKGEDRVIYEDDDLVLFTMHPEDERIKGDQWMQMVLSLGVWMAAFTRYPKSVDPSRLRGSNGLYFPLGYAEPGYSEEDADGGDARLYVALVPVVRADEYSKHGARLKIVKGRRYTDDELASLMPHVWQSEPIGSFTTVLYQDRGEFPYYPYRDDAGMGYVYPLHRVVHHPSDFLVFCGDYDPLPGELESDGSEQRVYLRRQACFVSLKMGYEPFLDFDPAVSDRILVNLMGDVDRQEKYRKALEWVMSSMGGTVRFANPSADEKTRHIFERDPWGDMCGTNLFTTFSMPLEMKMLNLPLDIALSLEQSTRTSVALAESVILAKKSGVKDYEGATLGDLLSDDEE